MRLKTVTKVWRSGDETKGDCARSIQGSMGPAGPRSWINLVQRDETGNVGIRGWIDASGTLGKEEDKEDGRKGGE